MNSMTKAATIASARRAVKEMLARGGIDSAEADARLLIAHALGVDRTAVMTRSERILAPDEIGKIDALAARRLRREPVARIIGAREFWSLMLAIDPSVLVPRPETETVVELALDGIGNARRMNRLRILDIGTGSGALLLALLKELPQASGVGTDTSADALRVARANAERHGLSPRSDFINCDVATAVQGQFDLIVSNPPYIARHEIADLEPEVRDHDPVLALDGGPDGLDLYRAIASAARRLLVPGGRLVVELGLGQEAAVGGMFSDAKLTDHETRRDLAGIPRALAAIFAP